MAKSKTKFKGVVKGAALGFALIMASAFFPANAIMANAETLTGDNAKINTSRIQVEGNSQNFFVKKGEDVEIPSATYEYKKTNGTQGSHVIGQTPDADATEAKIESSKVIVSYKATGDVVAENVTSFNAAKVGTYVITYQVVVDGIPYSYDILVSVEASEVSFEFDKQDDKIIPSYYDIAYAGDRDVVLPLPKVDGENSVAKENYVRDEDELPAGNEDSYVKITLANGSNKVSIKNRTNDAGETEYYLDHADLKNLDGQEIKILYSFYQKTANGYIFVTSTSKTMTVYDNHFYKDSNKTVGYDLTTSFVGTKPTSAVVGNEVSLPTIKATTSSKNTPANEEVEVYYDIEVYKQNANGNYKDTENIASTVITEDGKFKAVEEGSYKFVYKVHDFYNTPATESATTFEIKNVKDTISAKAFVYDASNKNAYNAEEKTYESAETLLKNQTVNRNVIMYAIGGTDNMVKRYEDLTEEEKEANANYVSLKRVITDNNNFDQYVVNEKAYHAYNLIFNPKAAPGSTTSVWKTIVSDNYQIFKQMTLEGKNVADDSDIKDFLLKNNYRLVTNTFNKDLEGNTIVTEEGLTDEQITEEMLEAGYAYVKPETTNYSLDGREGTFKFYYYAEDNVNNNKPGSVYFPVKLVNSYDDEAVPTITFSTNLQAAYLPNDIIEFNVATAADSDTRIQAVTAYRFLDKDQIGMPADEKIGTTTTLKYVVENAKTSFMKPVEEGGKWYAQKGLVSSDNWYVDSTASSYKVDLSKVSKDANYIEILAYAVDDYGNVGFFNKIIRIANTTDSNAPELTKVVNTPETSKYKTGSISLPTLYFNDENVNYMHAEVKAYKLEKDQAGKYTKSIAQASGMLTSYDTYLGYYKVDAGILNAPTEGDYQVAVTVVDSANHIVTSYFNYSVEANENTEKPKIDNITSDPIELEPGQAHYLVPPTFTMLENDKYGYIGIQEQDDAYTSTYYNVSLVSATSSDYELDESYFIGNSSGTYKLKYTAFLIQYKKDAVVSSSLTTAEKEGKLFFVDGKLKYQENNTEYFIYIDRENNNVLAANQVILGEDATALSDMTKLNKLVEKHVEESEEQLITVSEVFIKVSIDDESYQKNKYENTGAEVDIVKPSVEFIGNGAEMNKKESTVTITRTLAGTTYNVATINFEEWQEAVKNDTENFKVSGNDIKLILKDHGEYKIQYSIQAKKIGGGNIGEPNKDHKYTIASGDTEKPTIEIDNKNIIKDQYGKVKQVFNKGDKVVINIGALTVEDKATSEANLLPKLEITYRNKTLNESAKSLTNKGQNPGEYLYEIEGDKLQTAGEYVITFTVRDDVGNISEQVTATFEVSTEEKETASAKEVMGGVLIGVSVALLAGVVGYFVVSKVKLDKKEKAYKSKSKDKKDKE